MRLIHILIAAAILLCASMAGAQQFDNCNGGTAGENNLAAGATICWVPVGTTSLSSPLKMGSKCSPFTVSWFDDGTTTALSVDACRESTCTIVEAMVPALDQTVNFAIGLVTDYMRLRMVGGGALAGSPLVKVTCHAR